MRDQIKVAEGLNAPRPESGMQVNVKVIHEVRGGAGTIVKRQSRRRSSEAERARRAADSCSPPTASAGAPTARVNVAKTRIAVLGEA